MNLALSDIEINAVIIFTKTADYSCLDIPVYEVANTREEAHGTIADVVLEDLGSTLHAKAHSSTAATVV